MKFGTRTKRDMPSSKITNADVTDRFQDDRRRHVGNSSACYKEGTYHSIGTQWRGHRGGGGGKGFEPRHLPPGQLLGFVQNRREIFFGRGRGTPVSCFSLLEIVTV
jgi:hypothetical protein